MRLNLRSCNPGVICKSNNQFTLEYARVASRCTRGKRSYARRLCLLWNDAWWSCRIASKLQRVCRTVRICGTRWCTGSNLRKSLPWRRRTLQMTAQHTASHTQATHCDGKDRTLESAGFCSSRSRGHRWATYSRLALICILKHSSRFINESVMWK